MPIPRITKILDKNDLEPTPFNKLIIKDTVREVISMVALVGISNFENEDIQWTVEHIINSLSEDFELG